MTYHFTNPLDLTPMEFDRLADAESVAQRLVGLPYPTGGIVERIEIMQSEVAKVVELAKATA